MMANTSDQKQRDAFCMLLYSDTVAGDRCYGCERAGLAACGGDLQPSDLAR